MAWRSTRRRSSARTRWSTSSAPPARRVEPSSPLAPASGERGWGCGGLRFTPHPRPPSPEYRGEGRGAPSETNFMSDQLLIHKGKVQLRTEEGQQIDRPESLLHDMLRGEFVPPWQGQALPDGVKLYEWRPPF